MNVRNHMITEADFDRLSGLVKSRRTRVVYGSLATTLQQELARGQRVAPARVPKGVVTMNSKVRVRDLKSDETEDYTLVYPEDANIMENRVSVLAPLGRAILGARAGEVVLVDAPTGQRKMRVERLLYQPEAAGDFHL